MSKLYELKLQIEETIKKKGLDAMDVRGRIGLKTGMLFALISPNTPDNPESVAKFKNAARDVLNLSL